jgi:hypothetical protein
MVFYFEARRLFPFRPSRNADRELPPSIADKVLLLNETLRQKVRPAELAQRPRHHASRSEAAHQHPAYYANRSGCRLARTGKAAFGARGLSAFGRLQVSKRPFREWFNGDAR